MDFLNDLSSARFCTCYTPFPLLTSSENMTWLFILCRWFADLFLIWLSAIFVFVSGFSNPDLFIRYISVNVLEQVKVKWWRLNCWSLDLNFTLLYCFHRLLSYRVDDGSVVHPTFHARNIGVDIFDNKFSFERHITEIIYKSSFFSSSQHFTN